MIRLEYYKKKFIKGLIWTFNDIWGQSLFNDKVASLPCYSFYEDLIKRGRDIKQVKTQLTVLFCMYGLKMNQYFTFSLVAKLSV